MLGGQRRAVRPGERVRIWPYTLTFEQEAAPTLTRAELEAHLRGQLADLELEIHKQLLARLDLFEIENQRQTLRERVLLLENHIEDICRELGVFHERNEGLLAEIAGLALRDLLIHQLVMEADWQAPPDLADAHQQRVRRAGHAGARARDRAAQPAASPADAAGAGRRAGRRPAASSASRRRFADVFPLVRPHLHGELRKYLILRTLKKDLKDTVFGFGPLQDLLRAPNDQRNHGRRAATRFISSATA